MLSTSSDSGIPLEEISRLVGHKSTAVTELVYRKQIRPVLQSGAVAMDRIFDALPDPSLNLRRRVAQKGS
jgi:integrase